MEEPTAPVEERSPFLLTDRQAAAPTVLLLRRTISSSSGVMVTLLPYSASARPVSFPPPTAFPTLRSRGALMKCRLFFLTDFRTLPISAPGTLYPL
ncbi:hypothetical protein OPV22_006640 [Ensete ventricosum]|uniref:Uncharacterized protein n=1 Tax=Ensete ventricosum TaxID=4639 RepID=A0AAV8RQ39_ENSVE|nr:hypothetical protein OPV22_006640 [Ensete ventricosum]RZS22982.1 hypothetical protein BHM03_00055823 [Ensete ventricosum]